jgi:hypothetical protein
MSDKRKSKSRKKKDKNTILATNDSEKDGSGERLESIKGYLEMRTTLSWQIVFCILIEGSFYWFKNATDDQPLGCTHLKDVKIIEQTSKEKKPHCFTLEKDNNVIFTGALKSANKLKKWTRFLLSAENLPEAQPPIIQKVEIPSRQPTTPNKKGSTTAKSLGPLSKKMSKLVITDASQDLLNLVKQVIKVESGSAKKADEFTNNITKLCIKGYALVFSGVVEAKDFLIADRKLRDAFEIFVKVYNGRSRVPKEKISEALENMKNLLLEASLEIERVLKIHLPKDVGRLHQVFNTVSNFEFLDRVIRDSSLRKEVDGLVESMRYYTKLHYHT